MLNALISGIANTAQAAINAKTARRNTDLTNQANRELAQYAYSKDLEMWNKGNAYNSPEAQMQRLKAAGLNPNMVYGSGSVAGNTAGQLPKYQAPRQDYNYQPPVDLPATITAFQDFQIRNAQLDNLRAQRKAIEQNTFNKEIAGRLANQVFNAKDYQERWKAAKGEQEFRAMGGTVDAKGNFHYDQNMQDVQLNYLIGRNQHQQRAIDKMIADTEHQKLQNEWYTTKLFSQIGAQYLNTAIKGFSMYKGRGTGWNPNKYAPGLPPGSPPRNKVGRIDQNWLRQNGY